MLVLLYIYAVGFIICFAPITQRYITRRRKEVATYGKENLDTTAYVVGFWLFTIVLWPVVAYLWYYYQFTESEEKSQQEAV